MNCTSLSSIAFPAGLKQIGTYAFDGCTKLASAPLNASLTAIGGFAFRNCPIISVSMPGTLTTVGKGAFYSCTKLKSLRLSANLTTLGADAFNGCTALTGSIALGSKLQAVGAYTFKGCAGIGAVTLPVNVVTIGEYAFYGCTGMTLSGFPATLTTLGEYAFSRSGVTSAALTGLGAGAFAECPKLTSASIPGAIGELAHHAFYACPLLSSVTLPSGLTAIRHNAFEDCKALAQISIPNSVSKLYFAAFRGSGLTSVKLPDSLTSMSHSAYVKKDNYSDECFANTPLTTVALPPAMTELTYTVFMGCTKLMSFTQPAYTSGLKVENGVVVANYTDGAYITNFPNGRTGSYTIPDNIYGVYSNAFSYTNVATVVFPATLKQIVMNAFKYSGLVSVNVPSTVVTVSSNAFAYSDRLTSATVAVENAADYMFEYCTALRTVTFEATTKKINAYGVLADCPNIDIVTIMNSTAVLGTPTSTGLGTPRAIMGYEGSTAQTYATTYNIEFRLIGTGESKLYINGAANTVFIGERMQLSVMYYPHKEITAPVTWAITGDAMTLTPDGMLTVVGEGVATITATVGTDAATRQVGVSNEWRDDYKYKLNDDQASYTVEGFKVYNNKTVRVVINIPSSYEGKPVTAIGSYAFQNAVVETVHLPPTITKLDEYAFSFCKSITSITLPASLVEIGECVFWWSDKLASITIPKATTAINMSAFNQCYGLKAINVESGNTVYKSVNGLLLSADGKTLLRVPGGVEGTLTLPSGITKTGIESAYDCPTLITVNVPGSVTEIGKGTFQFCENLSSVTFAEGANNIGQEAFIGCKSLASVLLPRSMTSIHNDAFAYVKNLSVLGYVGSYAQTFAKAKGFAFVDLNTPITSKLTIPANTVTVADNAFAGCAGIQQVSFAGKKVPTIGEHAFGGCAALRNIDIPASVTQIADSAFDGCPLMTIVCVKDSKAHQFAAAHGIPFTLK